MHTIKPVKRFDSVGSQREFVESTPFKSTSSGPPIPPFNTPSVPARHISHSGDSAECGKILFEEVLNPTLQSDEGCTAKENQAIEKIREGFEDFVSENPTLAWQTFVKVLERVNRSVSPLIRFFLL